MSRPGIVYLYGFVSSCEFHASRGYANVFLPDGHGTVFAWSDAGLSGGPVSLGSENGGNEALVGIIMGPFGNQMTKTRFMTATTIMAEFVNEMKRYVPVVTL